MTEGNTKLKQKADQIIKSSIENVVLVLGKNGVGKTPFTKWMTQDNTKLISVQPQSEDDPYLMEDSDNKIDSSTTKSATVFPDLYFLNDTIKQAYYDFPGFLVKLKVLKWCFLLIMIQSKSEEVEMVL